MTTNFTAMPIKKENKHLYPKNWKKISEYIRFERAGNKCEVCGIRNYAHGIRHSNGEFQECPDELVTDTQRFWAEMHGFKIIKIVLTVAHLDHDPTNNDYSNLKAMCQKCHNNYDKNHRKNNRKNQPKLF